MRPSKKKERDVEEFVRLYGKTTRPQADQDPLYQIAMGQKAIPEAQQSLLNRIKLEANYNENPEGAKDLDKGERDSGE